MKRGRPRISTPKEGTERSRKSRTRAAEEFARIREELRGTLEPLDEASDMPLWLEPLLPGEMLIPDEPRPKGLLWLTRELQLDYLADKELERRRAKRKRRRRGKSD
jgi:hypothetical protein